MSVKMILGGYTFTHNPNSMDKSLEPELITSAMDTWESVAYFSWPATNVGKRVTLIWGLMTVEQYTALQAKWVADTPHTFQPNAVLNYSVMIMNLQGQYFLNLDTAKSFRKDVKLELLFLT
jgi:hypothetical protein